MRDSCEEDIVKWVILGQVYETIHPCEMGDTWPGVYQTVLDKRSTELFLQMSRFVANQIYDGRYFDPSTRAALAAIDVLAS
eukprot:35043-Amorphochlora_amoeboformis.AAC.1